ncbi:hypothetical protein D3C87_1722910 [compost metagenome]
MTSCEIIVSLIGRPTGTWRALISRWPPGCSSFHIHCLATTAISSASAGGRRMSKYTFAPQAKRIRKIAIGRAVQAISIPNGYRIRWVRSAWDPRRYLIPK